MIKREAFSVNAERLKEIMAKETSADGTPKNPGLKRIHRSRRDRTCRKNRWLPRERQTVRFPLLRKRLKSMK